MVNTSLELLAEYSKNEMMNLKFTHYWTNHYAHPERHVPELVPFLERILKQHSIAIPEQLKVALDGMDFIGTHELLQFIANQYEFYLRKEIPLEQYKLYCIAAGIRLYLKRWRFELSKHGIATYMDLSKFYKSDITYIYKDMPTEIRKFHQEFNTDILTEEDLKLIYVEYSMMLAELDSSRIDDDNDDD